MQTRQTRTTEHRPAAELGQPESAFDGVEVFGHGSGETFTLEYAAEVTDFAQAKGVGRLAFWSLNRDQQCDAAQWAPARDDCSGVSQDRLDFTETFLGG